MGGFAQSGPLPYAPVGIQRRQYIPVADRCAPPIGTTGNLSTASDKGTGRIRHTLIVGSHSHRVVVCNWYNSAGTETDGPNDIIVGAAIEPATTKKVQGSVPFVGSYQATIKPGKLGAVDTGTNGIKGQNIYSDVYVEASTGQFPRGGITSISANGEGNNYGGSGTDLTAPGSATVSSAATRNLGPVIILGLPTVPGCSVVGIVGDSIAAGTGDSGAWLDGGFIERALNLNYSYVNVALPSQTVDGWYAQEGLNKSRQQAILDMCGVTHIICELGVNGLSAGLATWQSHIIGDGKKGAWSCLAAFGVPVWQTTITPQTTTTDGWATVGNQTLTSAGNETVRLAVNAWLRDGAPITAAPSAGGVAAAVGTVGALRVGQTGHPLAGIIEVADTLESARDSGKFKAGVSYTVTAASTTSNVVTVTTSTAHGLAVGDHVSIVGVDAAINSSTTTYVVTVVGSATSFSFAKTTANATYAVQGTAVVAYTSDGTHPSQIGHAAAAVAVVPATLGLVAAA